MCVVYPVWERGKAARDVAKLDTHHTNRGRVRTSVKPKNCPSYRNFVHHHCSEHPRHEPAGKCPTRAYEVSIGGWGGGAIGLEVFHQLRNRDRDENYEFRDHLNRIYKRG